MLRFILSVCFGLFKRHLPLTVPWRPQQPAVLVFNSNPVRNTQQTTFRPCFHQVIRCTFGDPMTSGSLPFKCIHFVYLPIK